jgi:iron complex outermembrane receptor protein
MKPGRGTWLTNRVVLVCVAFGALFSVDVHAQSGSTPAAVAVAPMPLSQALAAFAKQSGLQLVYVSEAGSGVMTKGAPAGLTPRETLTRLLEGTGLGFEFLNERTVRVFRLAAGVAGNAKKGSTAASLTDEGVASADSIGDGQSANDAQSNESNRGNKMVDHRSLLERLIGLLGFGRGHDNQAGRVGSVLALAGSQLLASTAMAQNATSAAAGDGLEEVVVTAQHYSQDLEKTPLAITAMTGESLQQLGITTTEELSQIVPNLEIAPTTSSAQVAIRGAVSTGIGDEGDPAVAFNVDGVYLARPRAAIGSLYDIDRVEVLRGPQGTLWGRNSIGGTINVVTNKPDLQEFSAAGTLQYGNYNELLTSGMLNMPVSDTLGLRAAFQSERHDGYNNNYPARNSNDLDAIAGRLEALWKPSDSFSALLALSTYHDGGVGLGSFNGGYPTGIYAQNFPGVSPYNFPMAPGEQYEDERADDATLTLDWQLPLFNVTYIGNMRYDKDGEAGDGAVNGPEILFFRSLPNNNSFGGSCLTATDPTCTELKLLFQSRQFSNELRLSKETDSLKFVVGLMYFKEDADEYGSVTPCPCNPAIGITFNYPSFGDITHAAFTQATWSLTKSLRVTGGLRYNDDFKGQYGWLYFGVPVADVVGVGPNDCIANACSGPPNQINYASEHFHKITWKGGLDYDLSADTLLFGSVATGYKDGGFQDGLPPDNLFKPENMIDYEIGAKSQLLDHRLQINVDLFHQLYTDYQVTASKFVPPVPPQTIGQNTPVTVNAGRAEINGIELETQARVTPVDRVNFNATLMHAWFYQFDLPDGDGFNNNQPESLAGKNVPYVPHISLHLTYSHTFELANGGSIVPQLDTAYVSDSNLDYHNFPAADVPAYTRTGLSLTYNAPKNWSAQIYGKNLENHAVLASLQMDNSVPLAYEGTAGKDGVFMPPRTFGIKFMAHL